MRGGVTASSSCWTCDSTNSMSRPRCAGSGRASSRQPRKGLRRTIDSGGGRPTMTNLPSGTVTFLFTDIEESATLWEQDQVAMAVAVARQHTILRTAIETHHGV